MTTSRLVGGAMLCLSMSVGAVIAQEKASNEKPSGAGAEEASLDARLHIHAINAHALHGAQPAEADFKALAEQKGVTRIISLLTNEEAPAGQRQAAEEAGISFEQYPLQIAPSAPGEQAHIDREAVRRLVERLKSTSEGTTYIHGVSGGDRGVFVKLAYRLLAEDGDYAEALAEARAHGFVGGKLPGLIEDIKLLASGLEELPTIEGLRISDRDLLSRGEAVTVRGVRLNVKKMGEGPAIYILHGGPGETHTYLRPYLDDLAQGHTLVYYDQRGCGLSSKPQFKEAFTLDRLVAELDGLRETRGDERISLVAHSCGGALALRYALTHRERVDRMVIVASWASGEEFARCVRLIGWLMNEAEAKAVARINTKAVEERRGLNDAEFAEHLRIGYPHNFFGLMSPAFRDDWNRRAQCSAFVLVSLLSEVRDTFDIREELGKLAGLPTLVIAGKFDVITPPSIMKSIAERIASARFEVFERSGHYPFVEEHDKFIALVSGFLAGEGPGPSPPPATP